MALMKSGPLLLLSNILLLQLTCSYYTFLKFFFAVYKCELMKHNSASLYSLSQNILKYTSDIDQAVTFSSKEGKQYQIE